MALPEPGVTFFVLGGVILLGSAALWVFQRTRFPDVPLLMALGLLLGPLNAYAVARGWGSRDLASALSQDTLRQIGPTISNLALILILFDSGLKLDFRQFGRSLRPALLHTFPLFLLTVMLIAAIGHWVLGMPLLVALILGVALSNVGQTVSAAILREMNVVPEVRSIYFAEMALYDLVSVPILVGLLQFAEGASPDVGLFMRGLASVLSMSVVLGVLGGILWIYALLRLERYAYSYMVTFAAILLLFAFNRALGGSGVVSVLIFGLVVGNRASVMRMIDAKGSLKIEGDKVTAFHDEITFFVRAFFFVYLGFTFSTTSTTGEWPVQSLAPGLSRLDHTAALFLLGVALILAAIIIARYIVVRFVSSRNHPERRALMVVYGRGLGTAVLATFAFNQDAYRHVGTPYYQLFGPWQPIFTNAALLVVLLTVVGSSFNVWRHERAAAAPARVDRQEIDET